MPKPKPKLKPGSRSKSGSKSMPKLKPKARRWTAARLLKLAPEQPREASRDVLLDRIGSLLTVPDTPTWKRRSS